MILLGILFPVPEPYILREESAPPFTECITCLRLLAVPAIALYKVNCPIRFVNTPPIVWPPIYMFPVVIVSVPLIVIFGIKVTFTEPVFTSTSCSGALELQEIS